MLQRSRSDALFRRAISSLKCGKKSLNCRGLNRPYASQKGVVRKSLYELYHAGAASPDKNRHMTAHQVYVQAPQD